jgi:hypothetical protein
MARATKRDPFRGPSGSARRRPNEQQSCPVGLSQEGFQEEIMTTGAG